LGDWTPSNASIEAVQPAPPDFALFRGRPSALCASALHDRYMMRQELGSREGIRFDELGCLPMSAFQPLRTPSNPAMIIGQRLREAIHDLQAHRRSFGE
jgi:hypothetical protein